MAIRKTNSPWGSAYKEGLPSTAVNDRVAVDEILYPSVNTGDIDVATGQWEGVRLSDKRFFISDTAAGVANGASVLFPNTADTDFIDMTGYNDVIIAMKPTRAGNFGTTAVMGPDTHDFANLSPVNAAATLKGTINDSGAPAISNILVDGAESLTVNVWNIFYIGDRVRGQKLLQFKIENLSGGASDIDFAYLRLI